MRAFAAVFTREIFERRFAFVVAFAAGFVPLIGSGAFFGWSNPDAAEGRVLVALVGATALSAAFAILLGGAALAGETKEKRISFYFARPIPSGAIWAGKLLAAIAITVATALLAFAPGWLSGAGDARTFWGFDATLGSVALAAFALAVVLVLGSHAVVTVARLRSPWVALDLLLAPTLVFLAAIFLRSLLRNSMPFYEEWGAVRFAAVALPAAVLIALVLATLVQVAEGRTDARRAHGAFSATLFGVCGFAVALLGGYSLWCASAKATDLLAVAGGAQVAPRGTWLAASGLLSGGRGGGSFVFDGAGRRSIRTHTWNLAFSQDGARAAWGEPRFGFFEIKDNRSDLYIADLAAARRVATGLEAAIWSALVFSPTGRRLAVQDGQTLAAYDVSDASNPKQLAAFPLGNGTFGIAFVDEDTLRVFPRVSNARRTDVSPAAFEIREISLSSKRTLVTGRFDRETLPFLRVAADARTLVGTRRLSDDASPGQVVTLHDGRTGALVTTLADGFRNPQTRFLSENRLVVLGIADAKARALFFEGEKGWGSPARMVELGAANRVVLGGEIAPGRVAISLLPFEDNLPAAPRAAKLVAVDAATGAVSTLGSGLVPADRFGWWYSSVLPPAEAGLPWAALFVDASGRLVRLDPASGARTVLLGKGK